MSSNQSIKLGSTAEGRMADTVAEPARRRVHARRGGALAVLAAMILAIGAAWPDAAYAALPGKNGKIAFYTNRDGNLEIYVMDADGSNPTNLTNNAAADSSPGWSPDGTKIAFSSDRDGNSEIWVMDADGSNPTRLTNNTPTEVNGAPVWSPDGTKIAFVRAAAPGFPSVRQVWVMNADGSNQTNLSNTNTTADENPAWSPDGTKIAFSRNNPPAPGTVGDIWVMDANGANQTQLTFNFPFDTGQPDWSPDGAKIAFIRFSPALNYEVYVMNADGTNQVQLTNTPTGESIPRWSPDGTKIAFNTDRDGNTEVYVMGPDGSNPTNLTNNNAALDAVGSWQPLPPVILVIDADAGTGGRGALFRVHATTGQRTLLSNFGNSAQGPRGQDPAGVTVEADGTILVSDFSAGTNFHGALFRVHATTGQRTLLSNFGNSAQGQRGQDPAGVTVEADGTILVSDFTIGTNSRGVLFRVNAGTGTRTLLSNFGAAASGPLGREPIGVAVEADGAILVSDLNAGTGNSGALFRVDADTGTRTLLSDFGNNPQGPLGQDPIGVAVEADGTILVTDVTAGTGSRGALFRVDADTGTRTLLSDFGNSAQGPLGVNPYGVAVQ